MESGKAKIGEDLSNSTPHHVVVASPFQLGWKAVAVKSKHLPQVLFGMLTLFDPPVDATVFDPPVEPLLLEPAELVVVEALAEVSVVCDVA